MELREGDGYRLGVKLSLRKSELFKDLGYRPHASQILVHRSRAKRRVLACGTRFGKSTCGVMETIAALIVPGESTLGWLVGPTYDLTERIFSKVIALLNEHFPHRIVAFVPRERRVVILNLSGGLSELRAKSADRPESLLGEALTFLVVDEAASIRDNVWDEFLAPRLIDRNGWALLLSTPHARGWFHREFRRGQKGRDPDYESWQAPTTHNPHIKPELIEAERKRLEADTFAEKYEAEFIGPPEACDLCGGPSPDLIRTVTLLDDAELPACPECGEAVDMDGKTVVRLEADGQPHIALMRLMTAGLNEQELRNLRDWKSTALIA
jgi:hypothetical protein